MRARVLLLAIAILSGAVTPAALARGTSELGAVRAEYKKTALAEYFGSPAVFCAQLTPANRAFLTRQWVPRVKDCAGVDRNMMHVLRHCLSADGYSPSQWRNAVQSSLGLLKVHILSSRAVRITDPLLEHDTLVRGPRGWRFSSGYPPVEC